LRITATFHESMNTYQQNLRAGAIQKAYRGTDGLNRIAIFNSYYVPDEMQSQLYPAISPVNTFRVLFDPAYGLLQDVSYYSYATTLYDFSINPDTRQECK
jgi:hypothetical protein